jgi:hypothetical protein
MSNRSGRLRSHGARWKRGSGGTRLASVPLAGVGGMSQRLEGHPCKLHISSDAYFYR